MKKEKQCLDRREFTVQWVLAMLSGVVITVTDCGGSSGPTAPPTPAPDKVGEISLNHNHSAVITGAQLAAGSAVVLNIRALADHDHTVELSAAEVMQIASGQRVAKVSSIGAAPQPLGNHDHVVTFN